MGLSGKLPETGMGKISALQHRNHNQFIIFLSLSKSREFGIKRVDKVQITVQRKNITLLKFLLGYGWSIVTRENSEKARVLLPGAEPQYELSVTSLNDLPQS